MAVAEGGRRTFAAGYLKVTGRCASSWTVRREHQAELTMYSAIVFLVRVVSGAAVMFGTWFVFDRIHDRNTEIITAAIGLQYAFIFLISRRLDYFGLSVFSAFGRTVSYIRRAPYDQVLRDDIGVASSARHLYLNVLFAALIELLCVFRLFTSLLGFGWNALSTPINSLIPLPF